MDAIVLCSGYGTRLGDIGEVIPKPLLTIGGRPVIDYITSGLEKEKSVGRVIITSNGKFADQFEYWISMKRLQYPKELNLIVEAHTNNGQRLGSVGSTINAINEAKIKEDLTVIFGDNFYTFDIDKLLTEFQKIRKPCLVAYDIKSVEAAKKFGVIKVKGGRVIEFEEKPEKPKSTLVSTGIYYYPKEVLGMFKEYVKETGKTDAMGSFLTWFIQRGELHAVIPENGEWDDIGALETYKQLFDKYRKPRN